MINQFSEERQVLSELSDIHTHGRTDNIIFRGCFAPNEQECYRESPKLLKEIHFYYTKQPPDSKRLTDFVVKYVHIIPSLR